MDTIDNSVMERAAAEVQRLAADHNLMYVHTVTIVLNGAHGGADVIVKGFEGNDVSAYNERRVTGVIK